MKISPEILAKHPNKTLDKALRYLYASIVYLEVPLMAIRFEFNGETWEADTPGEAIALREKLERSTRFPSDPLREMDKQDRFWTPDRFMDVITGVGKLQHRFLMSIDEHPGITSGELMQHLGLNSEVALAGVISGLSKQLKQIGIEPKQTFQITVKWSGKKKTRTFILDDFFVSAGTEQNWPDAWKQTLKEKEDDAATTKVRKARK
jgi:hypothetical protein